MKKNMCLHCKLDQSRIPIWSGRKPITLKLLDAAVDVLNDQHPVNIIQDTREPIFTATLVNGEIVFN